MVSVVSVSTTKYAGIIKSLEVPLTLFAWSVICISTFTPIMTKNPTQRATGDTGLKHWESIIASILAATLFSSAFYLLEKLAIRLIAINFHKVQYEMRITENKWAVNMLAKLLSHSRSMFPRFEGDFMEEDHLLEPAAFTGFHQRKKGSGTGSTGAVTPMQFINGARRVFQVGAGIVGAVGQEVSGKRQPTDFTLTAYSIVVEALLEPKRVEALARRIWLSFVQEGSEALLPEDMLDVFGNAEQEQAEAAFTYFDEDMNGDISLAEMSMKIQEVAKERKAISASLKDTDSAIGKLDGVLTAVVGVIAVFIFIALLDTSFKTLLATSATTLLSLSFIFGVSCQEVLASLIFLFIKHPFDVSDRIVINDIQYTVQEMALMFTILKRSDGTQVQAPNSLLNTLFVANVRRSAAMLETVTLSVDFNTTFEQVEALRLEMLEFVKNESRDFQNTLEIAITDFSDLSKMKISMSIKHKSNWQNDSLRALRRNKWMCALALSLKKLEIVASGPGSGEADNPFVVRYIGDKPTLDNAATLPTNQSTQAGSEIPRTPAKALSSQSSLLNRTGFDGSFGSRRTEPDPFDVDLRRAGSSERVNASLPYTIAEENAILVAEEDNDAAAIADMNLLNPIPNPNVAADLSGLNRNTTRSTQLSNSISRTLTGRRSNMSQRRPVQDEETGEMRSKE